MQLHLVETGNPSGQAILFIHGWSESHLVWARQLNSPLSERFRLVALDNRGHGDSDKPPTPTLILGSGPTTSRL